MSEEQQRPSLAEVAAEPAEESTAKEGDVVGREEDLGGTVPADHAQSAPTEDD